MAIMKKGTFVVLDKNLKNVCVGDTIRDAFGWRYVIDKFGAAIKQDGTKHKLEDLGAIEICWPEEALEPEPEDKTKEEIVDEMFGPTRAEALELLTDQDLAEELRRRGYEVTATKTTIVAL